MTDVFDKGTPVGNPAGFMAGAINEGLGSTAAYNGFREAGGAMRADYFYKLYGEVSNSLATEPAAAALDPYSVPDANQLQTWAMGPGGEYVTSVRVWFREVGSDVLGSKLYDYKSDSPHTPLEAMLAAQSDYFSDDTTAVGGSGEGQTFVGAMPHQVYVTEPWTPNA